MTEVANDSLALIQSMADASPLAMAVSEGASHVLRYVNPAFCHLYDRPAAELLGRPFAEACPDDEGAAAWALLDRVFTTGAAETLADVSALGAGGASFRSYAVWPLLNLSGVATQVVDTTEHHAAGEAREEDLRSANQQLLLAALREDERSGRLQRADRAKDEFVAMLAHELRNPLAAIRTGVYLIDQRADPLDVPTRNTCALLERQMRHLSRLLDDLLDVSRITRGRIELRLEPVDMAQVLRHAVAATRSLLELKRHEFSLALPPGPVWVEADPVRLEQVVSNLLQNAIKYTDPGGHIWLSLEELPADTGAGTPHGAAVIRVRDKGIGLNPDVLLSIFDLFEQADPATLRAQGGLGIGLTLVKRLVELHGGTVDAQSAGLGQGSEFRIQLPLRKPTDAGRALREGPDALTGSAHPGGAPILLVEDNIAAATTLAEVLELWGYEVQIAHSGATALAAADAACPHVVLMDIGLPGMNGYEVAQRLRADCRLRETLLVALTGYGHDADRQRSQDAGFDYHLVKPIDLDELRRIIASRRAARESVA